MTPCNRLLCCSSLPIEQAASRREARRGIYNAYERKYDPYASPSVGPDYYFSSEEEEGAFK